MTMLRPVTALMVLGPLCAQTIHVQPAPGIEFPAVVDSNSPAYRSNGRLYLYNSFDLPIRSESDTITRFGKSRAVIVQGANNFRWIEAAWRDTDGSVYAWYHAEPDSLCPGRSLMMPEIGALVSTDGVNFYDLGVILRSGDQPDCDTSNTYFAGGHGDFSVILD